MEKEQILTELNLLVNECKESILPTKWYPEGIIGAGYRVNNKLYSGWHTKALTLLKMILSDDSDYIRRFAECEDNYYSRAEASIAILESLIEYIEKGFIDPGTGHSVDTDSELKRIFCRFYKIARQ